ncbi:hypothetical protein GE09DRAFT_786350 [Coniochaeta sp. 2T2.1]|nr:hypothetical protein GE09DRAFT_786350 [Coniochaeta sp. 2T2.1]
MAATTHYDTPPKRHGPAWLERFDPEKDDNELAAKAINRQNRRSTARRTILRGLLSFTNPCTSLPITLAAPQPRPFQGLISSHYFPEQYHNESLRDQTPWYLLLRCLFIDLPEQLENGLGTVPWRDHKVKVEDLTRDWANNSHSQLKWGQRVVFSERTEEQHPNWLTGRWLVVAYLWSDDREWARSENRIGKLVSLSNTVCIRAFENTPPKYNPDSKRRVFTRFYQLDRTSDNPEALITLFPRLPCYLYRHPPPTLPGTPVSQSLSRLCSLMNNEARAFLYGPSSSQDPFRDIWLGNTDRPCCRGCRMQTAAGIPPESSPSKPD